jgi:hypothetical protein
MAIDIRKCIQEIKALSDSWNESRLHFYHKRLSEWHSFFFTPCISYVRSSMASVSNDNVQHHFELKIFSDKNKNTATPWRGYSADKKFPPQLKPKIYFCVYSISRQARMFAVRRNVVYFSVKIYFNNILYLTPRSPIFQFRHFLNKIPV